MSVDSGRPSDAVVLTALSLTWLTPLGLVLPLPGLLRLVLVLAFALVVPGAAVVCRLRIEDRVVEWALTVTGSLAASASGSVVMAWAGWWHPRALLLVGAAACAVPLWRELRSRTSGVSGGSSAGR